MVAVNVESTIAQKCILSAVMPRSTGLVVETTRFGRLLVSESSTLTILDGLLAFEGLCDYCLIDHKPGSPFRWLQSLIEPSLAFVVVNPHLFFQEYNFMLGEADQERLQITALEDIALLTLVTISKEQVTTNLVGPLVINTRRQIGKQLVLSDTRYKTRHSLVPLM